MRRVPYCQSAATSGSTPEGVKSVTFVASSDFSGTVLGSAFAPGTGLTFRAHEGDILGAMEFTRSAGTLFLYIIP